LNENGKNVRVRVAGIIVDDERLLLISHKKGPDIYWLLPGGGVDFGESLEEALIREFKEELNITIDVHSLAFICDSIDPTGERHIINIFFHCSYNRGDYSIGKEERLLGYKFFDREEIEKITIFPPVNNELVTLMEGKECGIYIGKMWRK
jgi:ADP-ribose pyrophosphatase YjhB (NUDIX family)